MRTIYLLFLSITITPMILIAQQDAIIGEYWTAEKEGKIAIYKCQDHYCGKIVWRKNNREDTQNPNPQLRSRNVVGIQFLNNFDYNPISKTWECGRVYSIDNGNTYKGKMWLEDNGQTLKMRGFIGFSLLGRTASLERVKG